PSGQVPEPGVEGEMIPRLPEDRKHEQRQGEIEHDHRERDAQEDARPGADPAPDHTGRSPKTACQAPHWPHPVLTPLRTAFTFVPLLASMGLSADRPHDAFVPEHL